MAHAETAPERGYVTFKMLDYLDSQPGADRIRVRAPALSALSLPTTHSGLSSLPLLRASHTQPSTCSCRSRR